MPKNRRACEGAETKHVREGHGHFEQCRECKTKVRCDLVNHWFFGFKNHECEKREASE